MRSAGCCDALAKPSLSHLPGANRLSSMKNSLEGDFHARVELPQGSRFLPGTAIEIVRDVRLKRPPRFALFDFDGTLSLIREGWMDVMLPMMVDILVATGTRET